MQESRKQFRNVDRNGEECFRYGCGHASEDNVQHSWRMPLVYREENTGVIMSELEIIGGVFRIMGFRNEGDVNMKKLSVIAPVGTMLRPVADTQTRG